MMPPPPPVPSGVDAASGQILFDGSAPPVGGPSGAREPFPEAGGVPQAQGAPMPARGFGARPAPAQRLPAGRGVLGVRVSPFMAGLLGGITAWTVLRIARWAWARRR